MLYFDEHNDWYRQPRGAVTAGERLRLRLSFLPGECNFASVLIHRDYDDEVSYPMLLVGTLGSAEVFEAEIPLGDADLYWFYFRVEAQSENFIIDRDGKTDSPGPLFQVTVCGTDVSTPEWFKGGLIYHIFVDRYSRGGGEYVLRDGAIKREDWGGTPYFRPDERGIVRNNDFFGGTLDGVTAKLPVLRELGVTCLYLSPVFEAASNHKYDTGDFMRVDPSFGGDEALLRLCREARALGMAVILDGVFNHVGVDSRYFNRYGRYDSVGAWQSEDSPYYDWFNFRRWNDNYEAWWGIELLPATNKQSDTYRDFIAGPGGVIEKWMNAGVSGWRLDVVDELPDEILSPICSAIKNRKSDAVIIGEVWEDASNKIAYGTRRHYFLGGQLDSVMNYPLKDAIIAFVREGKPGYLAETMANLVLNYPKGTLDCLMNILGTHDTMRILTVLGGDSLPANREEASSFRLTPTQREHGVAMLKIASVLQFTLPGVPCVYYGDEAGMEGGADPFNRACYPWGAENRELLFWYRTVSRIRREHRAFEDGEYSLLRARDGVFAFSRGSADERVIVAANIGAQPVPLNLHGEFFEHITGSVCSECVAPPESAAVYTAIG